MSQELFLDGRVALHAGDCRDVLREFPDNHFDSVVTDPPYALVSITKRFGKPGSAPAKDVYGRGAAGFMGKDWDTGETAFAAEFWAEVYRVLKPGGHVAAFSGTRTYHRMACAIEDGGFEIRDQLAWTYGSGFPKSHDVSKGIDKMDAGVERRRRNLSFTAWMRGTLLSRGTATELLRAAGVISENGTMAGHFFAASAEGQPTVATRELFEVMRPYFGCDVPSWVEEMVDERTVESENFKRREIIGQKTSGIANKEEGARHTIGAGSSIVVDITAPATDAARQWQGWGTALKPAWEPICLARKPLIGTVAWNVLTHGAGAINVDGCRIHADDAKGFAYTVKRTAPGATQNATGERKQEGVTFEGHTKDGRWPANILHDGSDEVIAAFPNGEQRFFYCAKASKGDRAGSKHPTVKPIALMRWLCRLITPPGGLTLDPFAGSGTTGQAAWEEGFRAVLIEREAEYRVDIARRLEECGMGPDELTYHRAAETETSLAGLPLFASTLH